MKIVSVVLNYNDASTTTRMVSSICGYQVLDAIVVVDNASTDNSWECLNQLNHNKIHKIRTEKNGGYGYGNNYGVRYAINTLQADYVLISNPDVELSEACIQAMAKAMEEEPNCGVVSAMVKGPNGSKQLSCWKVMGFIGDLLDTGLVTRRIFGRWLRDHRCDSTHQERITVDAVPGSLLLVKVKALVDCDFYDEHVFLYYEEKILAHKMKAHGYRTILLTEESYVHRHSVSINKSVGSILKKQALQHESKLYYYKEYLKLNLVQMTIAREALFVIMAEIWFLTRVLGLRW